MCLDQPKVASQIVVYIEKSKYLAYPNLALL